MRIQHNIPAMNAYRNFRTNSSMLNKNLEKLSSGYKINRAGDDAAGLAISEKMRAQISGLNAAQSNAKDGISLVQTAEGALTEVHDMLNRMVTLAEQSANGTYGDDLDRKQLQKEVDQLRGEINRIADSANFNGIKLLDGSMDSANAVEASSKTQAHTTFSTTWTAFTAGSIASIATASGKYSEADSILGLNTIRHREAPNAGHASFFVDLNNFAVSEAGAMDVTVGTTALKTLSIAAADVSKGALSAATLSKKIAALYGSDTVTIDGNEFTISASGNGLKFESIENVNAGKALEVNIAIGSNHSFAFATLATASGVNTGAALNYDWASGVSTDTKVAFSGKNGGNAFTVTVGITASMANATYNGSIGSKMTGVVSTVGTQGRTARGTAKVTSTGIKVTAGANNITVAQLATTTVGIKTTVSNGTVATTTVAFNIALGASGLGLSAQINAGSSTTIGTNEINTALASAASDLKAIVASGVNIGNIGGPSASEVSTNLKNGVYFDGTNVVISPGSTSGSDTITLTFTASNSTLNKTVSLTMDFTVDELLGSNTLDTASGATIDAADVKTVIEAKVNSLFGQSKMLNAPATGFHGDVALAAATKASGVSSVTVAKTANGSITLRNTNTSDAQAGSAVKLDLTNTVTDSAGATTGTFIVTLSAKDIQSSLTELKKAGDTGSSATLTATEVSVALDKVQARLTKVVSASNYSVKFADIGTVEFATKNGTDLSTVRNGALTYASTTGKFTIATTAKASDVVTFKLDVGSDTIKLQMSVSELASVPEEARGAITLSRADVLGKVTEKLKSMFGETVEPDPTKTITLDAAPSGFEYRALTGSGTTSTASLDFTAGVSVGTTGSTVQVGTDGKVLIEVWSTGSNAAKVGTFTVDLNNVFVSTEHYAASATASEITATDALVADLSYKETITAAGAGDYNTSTEVIDAGGSNGSTRLASTMIKVSQFDNKIADGTVLKVGDTNYMFAVGASSALTQDADGNVLVDLKDLDIATGDSGLRGDNLETALERLTKAAGSNAMFGVGYTRGDEEVTLTEKVDYYGDGTGKVLLNHEDKIAAQIAWGQVDGKQSVETIETPEVSAKNLTLQIGDTSDEFNQLSVSIKDMHCDAIGIGSIDISTQSGAAAALDKIKEAINNVSDVRGDLGATQNRLEHTINNLSVMVENITDAESTIRDTDIAAEMMAYTKNSILNQAAQAMLAQANQLPQGVLQLLG